MVRTVFFDLKLCITGKKKDESDWGNWKHTGSFFQRVYGGDLGTFIALAITAAISIGLISLSAHLNKAKTLRDAATLQSGTVSASIDLAEAATKWGKSKKGPTTTGTSDRWTAVTFRNSERRYV